MCHEKEDLMTRERQINRPTGKYPNQYCHRVSDRDDLDLSHSFVHHLNIVIRQHSQYHLFVDVLLSLA